MNIGIQILETADGRAALNTLGTALITEWDAIGQISFAGDPNAMPFYVDHFLKAIRASFPLVFLDTGMDHLDEHAYTKRMEWANIDLNNFKPKNCAAIYFNYRVCNVLDAEAAIRRSRC